ncbi:putative pentatricopeptide [Lupinus albus]|uniref:Putative pentatricopeptide n=1 Tax=Lupinus albus TaxID=3870 RepID=A0A6A4PP55_LUPAL|nr:putative pentatricopeptide [Lupinus albus]
MFDEMLQRGIHPYIWSYNILMNCLLKLGKPDEANRIFIDIVLGEFRPSPAMYNVMINGVCKNRFIPQILTYNVILLMDFASLEEWV